MDLDDLVRFIDEMDDILDEASPNTLLQSLRRRNQEAEHAAYQQQLAALQQRYEELQEELAQQEELRRIELERQAEEQHQWDMEYQDAVLRSIREAADTQATRSPEPTTSVNWKKEGF